MNNHAKPASIKAARVASTHSWSLRRGSGASTLATPKRAAWRRVRLAGKAAIKSVSANAASASRKVGTTNAIRRLSPFFSSKLIDETVRIAAVRSQDVVGLGVVLE